MEIYSNSAERRVYLDTPVTSSSGSMNVVVKDLSGAVIHEFNTVNAVPGEVDRYYVTFPYVFCQYEGQYLVNWSFDYEEDGVAYSHTLDTYVEIVNPILPLHYLRSMFQTDSTEEEILGVESAVRHIINAHTGQSFGKYVGIKTVRGDGSRSLALPARLMRLNTVNGLVAGANFDITGGGFYLNYFPWGIPPVRGDYFGLHMHRNGVIHNPNNVKLGQFSRAQTFDINGEWGYDSVPEPVVEAAKLLVYDYATQEVSYRDRYLTSMTAADWRIQFHSGAFRETGNVRADQLLSEYVLKSGWAVI